MELITTTGFFEGKRIVVGNFDRREVYKINEYCISLEDISTQLLDSLKGKKITVTGKLNVIAGFKMPPKRGDDGRIYEPYKEPDKKFIVDPTFEILE